MQKNESKLAINKLLAVCRQQFEPKYGRLEKLESSRDNVVLANKINGVVLRIGLNKSITDTKNEVTLLKYMADRGFPCAKVLGMDTITYIKKVLAVTVFENISNDAHVVSLSTNSKAELLGAAATLAKLHNITLDFCRINSFVQQRNLDDPLIQFEKCLLTKRHNTSNYTEIARATNWVNRFWKKHKYTAKPNVIIHNDYRPQNVFFDQSNVVKAVIDFDWAIQSCHPEKDIAHAALEWSMTDGAKVLDWGRFKLFCKTYANVINRDIGVNMNDIVGWAKFAAFIDAVHYFNCYPERTAVRFESYMYDKYTYLTKVHNGT